MDRSPATTLVEPNGWDGDGSAARNSGLAPPEPPRGRSTPKEDQAPEPKKGWLDKLLSRRQAETAESEPKEPETSPRAGGDETVIEPTGRGPRRPEASQRYFRLSKRIDKTRYKAFATFYSRDSRTWKIHGQRFFKARFSPLGLMIEPIEDTHGVFVRLKGRQPIRIKDRTQILIGGHLLEYRAGRADASTHKGGPSQHELILLNPDGQIKSRLAIGSPTVRIGRGRSGEPAVELALLDSNISREHALLEIKENGDSMLTDLKSDDGTFVRSLNPLCLKDGDGFRVLHYYFRVDEVRDASS